MFLNWNAAASSKRGFYFYSGVTISFFVYLLTSFVYDLVDAKNSLRTQNLPSHI